MWLKISNCKDHFFTTTKFPTSPSIAPSQKNRADIM